MGCDALMYDGEQDLPLKPQCTAINEDLGQVGMIFSDKTGTLTANQMKLTHLQTMSNIYSLHKDGELLKQSQETPGEELNGLHV